jgi:hypothetical protein
VSINISPYAKSHFASTQSDGHVVSGALPGGAGKSQFILTGRETDKATKIL